MQHLLHDLELQASMINNNRKKIQLCLWIVVLHDNEGAVRNYRGEGGGGLQILKFCRIKKL